MSGFSTINQIQLDDNESLSKLYLKLDVGRTCKRVVEACASILIEHSAPATWFVTHDTPLLKELRSIRNFELGINPNFSFLLNGDARNDCDAEEFVGRLLGSVPEVNSVLPQPMTQSSVLIDLFVRKG